MPPTSTFPDCCTAFRSRPRLLMGKSRSSTPPPQRRCPPSEDDVVRYYGQYVALAVADTFESAKAAADAVVVSYAKEKLNVDFKLTAEDDPDEVMTSYGPAKRLQSERGDAAGAFVSAQVKLDQTYVTPAETHIPIE